MYHQILSSCKNFTRRTLKYFLLVVFWLALSNHSIAQVEISSASLFGSVDLIAGGAATPFDPPAVQETNLVVNGNIAISEDTGTQDAKNGLGQVVGTSQADGTVSIQSALNGLSLNGNGTVSSAYQATGQGTGGSNSNTTVEIYFTVSSDVDFNFTGEVSGDTTSTQDRVQVQRKLFGSWSVALAGADGTTGPVNTPATLQPGFEYRMYVSIATSASGGESQSPESENVNYVYDVVFEDGTTITGDINEVSEETVPLPIWSVALLGFATVLIAGFRRKMK